MSRARRLANRAGLDVQRLRDSASSGYQVARQLSHHAVTLTWDVGANDGGYAKELRRFGYNRRIVSFEPLLGPRTIAVRRAASDPQWQVLPFALGSESGECVINVAGNHGASSSFLAMLDRHREVAPEASYIGQERVAVRRLDDVWQQFAVPQDVMFLKIDVQGYEAQVLEGAREVVERCAGIQLEMSLVPLYEGALTFERAMDMTNAAGLTPTSLTPAFIDPATGHTLQVDGVFFRV